MEMPDIGGPPGLREDPPVPGARRGNSEMYFVRARPVCPAVPSANSMCPFFRSPHAATYLGEHLAHVPQAPRNIPLFFSHVRKFCVLPKEKEDISSGRSVSFTSSSRLRNTRQLSQPALQPLLTLRAFPEPRIARAEGSS